MAEFDLIVRNGTLHDGTGAAPRHADVAVHDGVVVEVGDVGGSATREIDADGAIVMPGIVDIHAHYDGQATWEERMQPSSWHGVTTVVMGNCGVGFAPVHDADHDQLIELMEGVEDIPGAALHEGLAWNWNSFDEFLDAVDTYDHDIDVAAQVPHGALRLHVMGERGANHEDATPTDIAAMADLAREAIEAGALGFTTSRTRNHKTSTGAYTPTLTAAPDELIGIAEGVGAAGTGVLQVVSDFLDVDDEFATLRTMVERSGRPMSISVARNPMVPDAYRGILDHITAANTDGLTMTGQVAPRAVGLILGLECTLNPFLTNPVFAEIADHPLADKVAALRNPTFSERLLRSHREHQATRERDKLGGSLITKFELLFEMADEPDYEPSLSDSLAGRARAIGTTPEELALEAMLGPASDGRGLLYLPFLNYVDGRLDAVHEMLTHPYTVPGLGDGGAHVGTICDGSFPTTLLQYWGRDRDHDTIPFEFLVQRHCQQTARTVGLLDRGVIAPGYRADINVVDFDGLRLHKPTIAHDLPAGGRRLLQRADGWLHTIVAGQETYRSGEATDALPGRLVRGAKPAPSGASAVTIAVAELQAEWRAADVADPTGWTLTLDADSLGELDEALATARSRCADVLDVTRADFPLPTLAPRLGEFAEMLINGRGFGRIGTLDVERLGPDDASWIYWGIGLYLGDPWPQNAKGHLLGDVRDQGKAPDDPTARGNEIGGHPLTFHSDGSDLVGLLCLNSGRQGGESLIANALFAHNELVRTTPELAAELYAPLPYDFRGEQRPGARPYYEVPTFTAHGERLFIRYIRPFIEASQRHDEAPRLTANQRAAMDAYDALVHDPDNQVEMLLQPGEMQFINNYHVLHGRRRYVDDPAAGAVRWLKRLWLATDVLGPDDRPDRYQRTGAMTHWGATRTKA